MCMLWAAGNSHEQAIFGTARYRCIAITAGHSDRGIRAKDGELLDEDLYLCTCAPGGEEFEIYIVVLERDSNMTVREGSAAKNKEVKANE